MESNQKSYWELNRGVRSAPSSAEVTYHGWTLYS